MGKHKTFSYEDSFGDHCDVHFGNDEHAYIRIEQGEDMCEIQLTPEAVIDLLPVLTRFLAASSTKDRF